MVRYKLKKKLQSFSDNYNVIINVTWHICTKNTTFCAILLLLFYYCYYFNRAYTENQLETERTQQQQRILYSFLVTNMRFTYDKHTLIYTHTPILTISHFAKPFPL